MWLSKSDLLPPAALALCLVAVVACTKAPDPNAPPEPLADKGRRVYMSNCVACHNANPKIDGPIGPAIAGSPKDLLLARLTDNGYPPGYKPKRSTKVMAPLPHLKGDVDALEAFLGQ